MNRPVPVRPAAPLLALAAALLALAACNTGNGNEEWDPELTFVKIRVLPARITVTLDEYVLLDERFRALAYTSDEAVKEVSVDIWQKISGIGSVVYNEFRSNGETGECHIQVVHREEYADLKSEVTVIVTGEVDLATSHAPDLAPEMRMPLVRADQYWIGAINDSEAASDELPRHRVWLAPYYISESEVTRATFVRFLNTRPADIPTLCDPAAAGLTWSGSAYEVVYSAASYPMSHVSYAGATAFCAWLGSGYRLPTEAEWEFAARGGTTTKYPYGATFDATRENVNTAATTPVKSYPANGYGLYDTLGNLREICLDWYGANYYATSATWAPTGPGSGTYRVLRGGSYLKKYGVRVAERDKFTPTTILPDVGFRIVHPSQ